MINDTVFGLTFNMHIIQEQREHYHFLCEPLYFNMRFSSDDAKTIRKL
jgi:hypothetical protein